VTLLRSSFCLLTILALGLTGCEALKASKPIIPVKEYERMIAGRLDANYVGTRTCLSACHFHDKIRRDFEASTMGAQLSSKSGMPLVDCESCHGPGSLAIEGITPEMVAMDAKEGKQTACNYKALIEIKNLPAGAQSLICLKCHTANATFNLHNWSASSHAINEVSCSECHKVHVGPDLTVRRRAMAEMCDRCHQEVKASFYLPSHHPVPEQKVFCNDCHDPHGSFYTKSMKKGTIKETCTQCHMEKAGPFAFGHADNTEDCITCHSPHGSVNNWLLTLRVPFLCLQCHPGHRTSKTSAAESKGAFYTRCTDCHSTIHGTDLPSATGRGRFTQ
jgi:DmsE family decaheme c-type cytochrome